MRKLARWFVLVGALAASALVALAACEGDDTKPYVFPDASPAPDGAADGAVDGAPPPVPAKTVAVHASPNAPPVRLCFASGTLADGSDAKVLALPPLPGAARPDQPYPGLFPGGGAILPSLGDAVTSVLVPIVVSAARVAGDDAGAPSCAQALGPDGGLQAGGDYFRLAPLPVGALAGERSLLLAVTGCLPTAFDPTADAAKCGVDFNPLTGNLALAVRELDRVVAAPDRLGAQVAHLSPQTQGKLQGNAPEAGVTAGFGSVAGSDAGAFYVNVVQRIRYGEVKPPIAASTPLANVGSTALVLSVEDPDGGGSLGIRSFPLADVLLATTGADAGVASYFKNGANYTFVLVGDPTVDGGDVGLHVLGFPSDPTVPTN
jgi:hypothetical protein